MEIVKLIGETSNNPLFKAGTMLARFVAMPISIPAIVLIKAAQSLNEPSTRDIAIERANETLERIFNNW